MARPTTAFRVSAVLRPLVLVLWCLLGWGTLMAAGIAWNAVADGWSATLRRLAPDAEHGAWGPVNLALAVVAVAVWTLVGVTVARRARGGGGPPR